MRWTCRSMQLNRGLQATIDSFFDFTLAWRWGTSGHPELAAHSTRTKAHSTCTYSLHGGGTTSWRSAAIQLLRMGIMGYRM
jgi:hypothetical protein